MQLNIVNALGAPRTGSLRTAALAVEDAAGIGPWISKGEFRREL